MLGEWVGVPIIITSTGSTNNDIQISNLKKGEWNRIMSLLVNICMLHNTIFGTFLLHIISNVQIKFRVRLQHDKKIINVQVLSTDIKSDFSYQGQNIIQKGTTNLSCWIEHILQQQTFTGHSNRFWSHGNYLSWKNRIWKDCSWINGHCNSLL